MPGRHMKSGEMTLFMHEINVYICGGGIHAECLDLIMDGRSFPTGDKFLTRINTVAVFTSVFAKLLNDTCDSVRKMNYNVMRKYLSSAEIVGLKFEFGSREISEYVFLAVGVGDSDYFLGEFEKIISVEMEISQLLRNRNFMKNMFVSVYVGYDCSGRRDDRFVDILTNRIKQLHN